MRNFLAILGDSIREAISGWVLQALLILAFLFMLFVAGLSFRPLSPEEVLTRRTGLLTLILRNDPNAGKPEFTVENFVQTNAPEPLWLGNYRFEMVVKAASADALKQAGEAGLPTTEAKIKDAVREWLPYFRKVEARTLESKDPGEIRVEISNTGTNVDSAQEWINEPSIFFAIPTGQLFWMSQRESIYRVEKSLVNDLGAWGAMLISIVVTAGFIPNLLRKGALDLYIAKPIGRTALLLYKYIGGLAFVFILSAFTIGGTWLAVGLRTDVWSPQFLLTILVMTAYFAILYAISTFVAVLTRNSLVAILATVMMWAITFGVGFGHESVEAINQSAQENFIKVKKMQGQDGVNPTEAEAVKPVPAWVEGGLYALRKALPRTYDLDKLSGRLIAGGVLTESELKAKGFDKDLGTTWGEVLGVSFVQILVLLGISCLIMNRRDG